MCEHELCDTLETLDKYLYNCTCTSYLLLHKQPDLNPKNIIVLNLPIFETSFFETNLFGGIAVEGVRNDTNFFLFAFNLQWVQFLSDTYSTPIQNYHSDSNDQHDNKTLKSLKKKQ